MFRPDKLDDIVGQERAKHNCRILIESATKRNAPLPHILFSGPAGTGKTTFSRALANERGVNIHLANGGALNSIKKMVKYLVTIEDNEILFIDEIHRLPIKVFEMLYTVMEDFRYDLVDPKTEQAVSMDVPPFALIGATTISGRLPRPLRDRFKHHEQFVYYTLSELSQIVKMVAKNYGLTFNDDIAKEIAKTCRENPRHAVKRTEWVRDVMVSRNIKSLQSKDLQEIIRWQGYDERGLTIADRRYLDELKNHKFAGLDFLSMRLNMDKQTVKDEIEPYLIRLNLIGIDKKGRFLNVTA